LSVPTDTADPIGELLGVVQRLAEVIEAETAALQRPARPQLDRFVAEKTLLAVRYDTEMRALATRHGETIRQSPHFPALQTTLERLGKLAQANARAIDLQLRATRRVLSIVARAAREATQPSFSYGGDRLGYGQRSPANTAVAVNRVL
jgi:flagellar biosynthesis/type III secretory pathway chaperone